MKTRNMKMALCFAIAVLFFVSPLVSFAQIVQSGNFVVDLSEGKGENPPIINQGTDIELLSNNGFETGTFAPWYHDGAWTISTNGPHTGTYSAYDIGNHWIRQDIAPTAASDIASATVWCRQPEAAISAIDFYYSGGNYSEDLIWPLANWSQFDVTSFIDPGTIVTGIRVWGYSGGGPDPDETFFDDLSIQTTGPPPDILVTLTPDTLPIIIPAGGGSFNFNIAVANIGTTPGVIDIWSMVTLPNGSNYGPVINFQDFTAPAGWSGDRDRTQVVPATAPSGNYVYNAYAGSYPTMVYAADNFNFSKSVTDNGTPIVKDWNNWGESFDDIITGSMANLPDEYAVISAYPNPFNNVVELSYTLPESGEASLQVYNISGELVSTIFAGFRTSGSFNVSWNASDFSSGVYLIVLNTNGRTAIQKAILLK